MNQPKDRSNLADHCERRSFIRTLLLSFASLLFPNLTNAQEKAEKAQTWILGEGYSPSDHYWGMGIDISKCIGCGRCVEACKKENRVPDEPFFFRTWVERYIIQTDGNVIVEAPVIANIIPQDVVKMITAFNEGKIKEAQELHYKMLPLIKAMFIETNPIPVKTSLFLMGKCPEEFRLPLVGMSKKHKGELVNVLREYGLIG